MNHRFTTMGIIVVMASLLIVMACTDKRQHSKTTALTSALLLTQAQFIYPEGGGPQPGPARMEIVWQKGGAWTSMPLEDPDSNVFHKALDAAEIGSPGRILTIGANGAFLKLWRFEAGSWQADVLWHPVFGGKHDRLRDIEIGDVTGDGKKDIVIATHDQGVIAVLQGTGTTWTVTELHREPKTFVHEIEIGDLNGNGIAEIYATPSAPNKMDGTPQPGKIIAYEFIDGQFVETIVEEFPERHVKEILVASLSPGSNPVLIAALEAELKKGTDGEAEVVDPVQLKLYRSHDGGFAGEIIAEIDDRQCRFLNVADVDLDGRLDLVASGFKSGIWLLKQPDDAGPAEWPKTLIDRQSSGYEHATLVTDFTGDGKKELFVAADDQRVLTHYTWNGNDFTKTTLVPLMKNTITFNVTHAKLPDLSR